MPKSMTTSIVPARTFYRTASYNIYRQSTVSSAWASTSQKNLTSLINSIQIHVDRSPRKSVCYFYPTLTRTQMYRQVLGKSQNTSFHENPSGGNRAVPHGQMDRETERYNDVNCGFSQTALRNRFKEAPPLGLRRIIPYFGVSLLITSVDKMQCIGRHVGCKSSG